MQSPAKKAALPVITLAALGVVFGDIGTSPLYALRQCFLTAHLAITEATVLGILSLIFWCMMLTISFKYVTIIMRADNNGEGGIMSLLALNLRTSRIAENKKNLPHCFGLYWCIFIFWRWDYHPGHFCIVSD